MSSSKQLKWGILISYVAIGINILTGLLYTPWMIHSIGRENWFVYFVSVCHIAFRFRLRSQCGCNQIYCKVCSRGVTGESKSMLWFSISFVYCFGYPFTGCPFGYILLYTSNLSRTNA